jgi:hypothetical protein
VETTSKPLLVGYAPGSDEPLDPRPLAYGSTGGRLLNLLELGSYEVMLEGLDVVNYSDKLRPFCLSVDCVWALAGHQNWVLLGRDVAKLLGFSGEYFKWKHLGRYNKVAVVIPHPSGRNRWYNSRENESKARKFLVALWKSRAWQRTDLDAGFWSPAPEAAKILDPRSSFWSKNWSEAHIG